MKIIYLEDDRIEEVSEGYARNFLLPRKLCILATPKALAAAEKRKEAKAAEVEKKRAEMKELADKLAAIEFTIAADTGEGGKLFGSVTAVDICAAVKKGAGVEIDKRKIEVREPIKVIGEYSVPVKLIQDISATLKIKVIAR